MAKHFTYDEVSAEHLVAVARYRDTQRVVKLHRSAAEALTRMIESASSVGIELVPISGFRSIEYQAQLFARSVEKRGSQAKAVRWVAPAGHSEHHTGLAVDLGEGPEPDSDAEPRFADTTAYRWLNHHAGEFGFELSFPENNAQGVGYEPWHWRFIGSPDALRTFDAARQHSSLAPK